jgi:two-component system, cell cycle sensor histidine kinase and response regulator CckA
MMRWAMEDSVARSVMDDLPVGVWVARAPDGAFIYANRTFTEIMGMGARADVGVGEYSEPYGIKTRDGQPYPEDKLPFVRAVAAKATVIVDDIVIHRHDGRKVHIRAQARPVFDDAGEITHVVIAFIDISREVEAELGRSEVEQRVRQMQRMDSIGILAGGIAHDFNNLLAAVKMIAAALRREEDDELKLAHLEQIDQVTDSAAQLTRSLLGFARRGKHLAACLSLHDVTESVARLMRRALGARIDIVVDLRAKTGDVVGDFSQLEQAVMNLIVNARDAMPDGGRIVIATRDYLLLEENATRYHAMKPGPCVVLEVTDGGTGVDPAIRDRIFEPYFTTKKGVEGGTGLGLATAWGIVENHSGAIEAVDASPRGTTIRVILPAAPAGSPRAQTPTPSREVTRGRGTVLVVDDERSVREATANTLRSVGYTVVCAEGGEAAIDLLRERTDIDVVLLDMVMPRMDGRTTYLALRDLRPDVRVVLTTGFALNEEAQRILDLGVREFIAKPFTVEHLSQVMARAVAV